MGTTYDSSLDLQLGQVPIDVGDDVLYQELLDVHNAIEQIATQGRESEEGVEVSAAFIAKYRTVVNVTEGYIVLATDRLVRVNAAAGDVVIALPAVADYLGYRFDIKRIDLVPANKVTLIGNLAELIDEHADGINISTKSSYTVVAHLTGWDII